MDGLYEPAAGPPASRTPCRPGEELSDAIDRMGRVRRLEREIAALEKQLRTEPQLNRKIELRRQIKERTAVLDRADRTRTEQQGMTVDKLKMHSPDLTQRNIDEHRRAVPHGRHRDPRRRRQPRPRRSTSTCSARSSPTTSSRGRRSATSSTGPASAPPPSPPTRPSPRPCARCARSRSTSTRPRTSSSRATTSTRSSCSRSRTSARSSSIYIDPPYNTGNDFVYEDDFAETTPSTSRARGQSRRRRATGSSPTPRRTAASTPTG